MRGRTAGSDGTETRRRPEPRRVRRERRTVEVMVGMYCRAHHGTRGEALCDDCRALHEYAMVRIDKCPFCPEKPTCANCPVHCYRPDPREHMRTVMRFAGPRMMLRHPYLAVMHVLDGRRRVERPGRRSP